MDDLELLALLATHFVLTALPGVAATLFVASRGVSRVPLLLAAGIAATGVVAMLTFWAYFADQLLGQALSYFVVFGSAALIAWSLWAGNLDRRLLRALAVPLALWGLGAGFLLFLGFLHGGSDSPIATASLRFSGQLPSDNDIPNFFTEWFYANGSSPRPPLYPPDWLVSDRPPLQIGYMLEQRDFVWDGAGRNYQVVGLILQQLWIVAVWALLLAARVGRLTRALAMIAVLLSPLAIVNGFFVWPKLLPAAMLIAAAALAITPLWEEMRRSLWAAALIAALVGLAMMGHGSSVFGVIPLALVAAWRGLPSWRWLGVAVAVGIVLAAPWSAYQKYGDPPGNRLNKWMLAGVTEVDGRGTSDTIFDSYEQAGVDGVLHNKGQNFVSIVGGGPAVDTTENAVDELASGDAAQAIRDLRNVLFFYLLPSLGLLAVAPLAMLLGRRHARQPGWGFAWICFLVLAVGAVIWALILFGNSQSRAIVHQGTYALPILGYLGAVIGLRSTYPRFAVWLVGIGAALMLVLYTPALDPPAGSSYSVLAGLLAALGLAGFVALSLRAEDGAEASA